MKRYRRLDSLLRDLHRLLREAPESPGEFRLYFAVANLGCFMAELAQDAGKLRQVLGWGEALRASPGVGRQVAEREFLPLPASVARACAHRIEDAGLLRAAVFPTGEAAPPELRASFEVLEALREYALGCFRFRRPRDAMGGQRRAAAFEVLGELARVVDLPEAVALASEALGKRSEEEARGAAGFLEGYFTVRGTAPDDPLAARLEALALRARSRSTVFRALNVLVETGVISDLEAMSRMDEWKARWRSGFY